MENSRTDTCALKTKAIWIRINRCRIELLDLLASRSTPRRLSEAIKTQDFPLPSVRVLLTCGQIEPAHATLAAALTGRAVMPNLSRKGKVSSCGTTRY